MGFIQEMCSLLLWVWDLNANQRIETQQLQKFHKWMYPTFILFAALFSWNLQFSAVCKTMQITGTKLHEREIASFGAKMLKCLNAKQLLLIYPILKSNFFLTRMFGFYQTRGYLEYRRIPTKPSSLEVGNIVYFLPFTRLFYF